MTEDAVHTALKACGNWRVECAQRVALEGPPDEISGALLLALGLRESGLQNINNQAGTDRGCFQISAVYHEAFLEGEPGCPAGSWVSQLGMSALDEGFCPRFTPALLYALDYLQAKRARAVHLGIPEDLRLRFALAAYNAGEYGALRGFREGDVDKYTTGRDYSAWVIDTRRVVNRVLTGLLPNWVVR